ncbi:MAG: hypothetical protein KGM24_05960 [Elusimicrobia bacterium]|nr:hypothetical protein [Elusimicrobiota bacterium]
MLLAALLAVLTASPAAALAPASCLKGTKKSPPPRTFDAFRACQKKARADALAQDAKNGRKPTQAQLDALDEGQRAEARKFFSNPNVVVDGPPAGDGDGDGGDASGVSNGSGGRGQDANGGDEDSGASGGDGAAASDPSLDALGDRLKAEAGDGKNGVTRAMAEQIRSALVQKEGSLSPDMKSLLDSVSRDGGKLTPETMTQLQQAARAAKAKGLELGIDPKLEKALLEGDFGRSGEGAQQPGSM